MKHHKLLLSALTLAWAGGLTVSAETITNFTVDFNSPIDVSAHDFRVAPNWKHIVGTDNYDNFGPYYMSYSYYESYGVDGSGCLKSGRQYAGDNWGGSDVYDLLVTPEVQGKITLQVKTGGSSNSFLEFWTLDDSGKDKGTRLKRYSAADIAGNAWITAEVDVADLQRIGIRASDVYIDNFVAASAEIEPEPAISFISVTPSNTTGVIEHKQNANGDVELIYQVSVKNTGQIALVAKKEGVTGTKNYSISLIGKNDAPFGAPVYVPYDLAIGETSPEFEVKVIVPNDEISTWWPYASSTAITNLRENLQQTVLKRANTRYLPYESKFSLCKEGAHSPLAITKDIPFGICSESKTVNLEIYNDGVAPLSVKSITLPEGFSTTAATGESSVESKSAFSLPIAIDATAAGYKAGELKITYLDNKGEERTHSVYMYGSVLPDAQWTADFGTESSKAIWPDGSFAEQSIQTSYGNQSGKDNMSGLSTYDNYLYSYYNTDYKEANNKFITPLLTATEGTKLYYGVARDKTEVPYDLKVFVSSDRKNWGEPVAIHNVEDEAFADGRFHQFAIDLPAGDNYVAFAVYGMKLNDLATTAARKEVDKDLYILNFKQTETQQSGKSFSPSVEVMAGVNAAANDYKVVYYLGDEAIAELPGEALTASATVRKTFNFSVSKEVETTSTLAGKVVFEFTDETRFESEPLDIVITNEPAFVFNLPGISDSYNLPTSLNSAINFGKTNTLNTVKSYEIFNWGTAPLQVTSITVPEGFTASIENATVAGKAHQAVDLTFSATTPGTYSGNLSIKYQTSEGEQEYSLPMTGIMLDPAKWYATFDGENGSENWPVGSAYQKNVATTNLGTSLVPNFALYSTSNSSTADRMFVTPLLTAGAGETLSFDAKVYSTGWLEGGVKVYLASSREALLSPDENGSYPEATLLTELRGEDLDAAHTLTTDFNTFSVTIPEAGNYYIGFESYSRCYIDEIYGLAKVNVDHDWMLEGSNVPTAAMQNVAKGATVILRNLGTEEAAGSYKVIAYVDGVAYESEGTETIPVVNKLSNEATAIPVSFRSPKTGTYPVYFEIAAGETKLATEPVNVTFAEEELASEIVVGTPNDVNNINPLNLYYKDTEAITLYSPALLGLSGGEKINSIVIKGKGKKAYSTTLKVYYEWVDEVTESKPEVNTNFDYEGMTQLYDGVYEWPNDEEGSVLDMITLNFNKPLVYPAGKSLRLLISSSNTSDSGYGNFGFMVSADDSNCWQHQDDSTPYEFNSDWKKGYMPILYLTLAVEERSVSGEVTSADGTPAANATVRLISNDGDNVQYAAQTNANGEYNVRVIQQGREYDIEVIGADGKEDLEKGVSVADESKVIDFALIDVFHISDESEHADAPDNAVVYIKKSLNPGYNAVTFPMALDAKGVKSIFGENVSVFAFDKVTTDGPATVVNFKEIADKKMEAGKPYLIIAGNEAKDLDCKAKGALGEMKTTSSEDTDFLATDRPTQIADKMFVLSDDNFVEAAKQRAANTLPAYSGYIKAPNATTLSFTTDSVETGIEEAEIVELDDDVIYNLNGIRVKNPEKGIYIINGKAVVVK